MKYLGFLIDSDVVLVSDTSFVINLNATGFSDRIVRAMPNLFVVTEDVLRELKDGSDSGHDDYEKLKALIGMKSVNSVSLRQQGRDIYLSLIRGPASQTLGDGEASTIAYAVEIGGIAVIDDKKAEKICQEKFPQISVVTTFDLLTQRAVKKALGENQHKEAIYNALRIARMRIPNKRQEHVVELIGENLATHCPSLSHKYWKSI